MKTILEHPVENNIINKNNKLDPDMKCAPSKKYTDGSCFSVDTLKTIAENFNKKNKNKIIVNQSKEQLVKELESRLSDKCDEQTCWLRLDIVKELNNEDILTNTFRPKGPTKKYEWLSTTHINDVIEQYHSIHKDFLFLGAVPSDFADLPILGIGDLDFVELEKQGKNKVGLVINLDEHWKDGSHWVGLFADLKKNQIYFFDSLGRKPIKRIRKYINKITKYLYNKKYHSKLPINDIIEKMKDIKINNETSKKLIKNNKYLSNLLGGGFDIRFNHIQHQFDNSECGVYSINFIIRLVGGESFDSVINNITKDEEMNANRKIYFRNVN
jgi:hypothetical protein